jgi:hypothetical protein
VSEVLEPTALALDETTAAQTWHCKTPRDSVMMVHGAGRHAWRFTPSAHPSDPS